MQSERGSESRGRVRVERGIYRQTNGRYAVCVMIDGRPSLRTVAGDLEQARVERELLREAAHNGLLTLWPRLTFGAVASQWFARFERRVATGERRERTLENYRYYLDHHLLPRGRAQADPLAHPSRYGQPRRDADRKGPGAEDGRERARPTRRDPPLRAPAGGTFSTTPWDDWRRPSDHGPLPARNASSARQRSQTFSVPASRVTDRCWRPLSIPACASPNCWPSPGPRLTLKPASSASAPNSRGRTWEPPPAAWHLRRAPPSATSRSPLNSPPSSPVNDAAPASRPKTTTCSQPGWAHRSGSETSPAPPSRTRSSVPASTDAADRRFASTTSATFASHLIVDLRLDVCQVSRILGHARTAITLDVYTHLFDRARHAADVRAAMADSRFAHILAEATATAPSLKEDARRRGRIGRARRAQHPAAHPRIRCQTRERRGT
jgi:integrase